MSAAYVARSFSNGFGGICFLEEEGLFLLLLDAESELSVFCGLLSLEGRLVFMDWIASLNNVLI